MEYLDAALAPAPSSPEPVLALDAGAAGLLGRFAGVPEVTGGVTFGLPSCVASGDRENARSFAAFSLSLSLARIPRPYAEGGGRDRAGFSSSSVLRLTPRTSAEAP